MKVQFLENGKPVNSNDMSCLYSLSMDTELTTDSGGPSGGYNGDICDSGEHAVAGKSRTSCILSSHCPVSNHVNILLMSEAEIDPSVLTVQ